MQRFLLFRNPIIYQFTSSDEERCIWTRWKVLSPTTPYIRRGESLHSTRRKGSLSFPFFSACGVEMRVCVVRAWRRAQLLSKAPEGGTGREPDARLMTTLNVEHVGGDLVSAMGLHIEQTIAKKNLRLFASVLFPCAWWNHPPPPHLRSSSSWRPACPPSCVVVGSGKPRGWFSSEGRELMG